MAVIDSSRDTWTVSDGCYGTVVFNGSCVTGLTVSHTCVNNLLRGVTYGGMAGVHSVTY